MQAIVDLVEKDNVNIGVGVSNGAVGTTITSMVHDSIIASILVFLEVFLTSLLGLPLLVTMFLLLLQIGKKQFFKFLLLVLKIERKMWCKFQSLALVDLDLKWILKVHNKMKCLKKNCPSTRNV
jgi:hypothetical protein